MHQGRTQRRWAVVTACFLGFAAISGCGGGGGGGSGAATPPPPTPPAPTPPPPMPPPEVVPPPLDPTGQNLGAFFAVTNSNRFVSFNPGASALSTNLPISGIDGLHVMGIDVRTTDGTVLLVTDLALFELNPRSGATRLLVSGGFRSAAQLGVEYLGATEELRLVGSSGQNNGFVGFGQLTDDLLQAGPRPLQLPDLPAGTAEIAATQAASPCGGPTVIYHLDTGRDLLLVERQQGARVVLDTVGALGLDAAATAGFEIFQESDGTDVAVATLRVNGILALYGIDLVTGRASLRSPLPPGLRSTETLVGLTRPPTASSRRAGHLAAITQSGKLISFDEGTPQVLCTPPRAITGLQSGEQILDIDVRPADGRLYALTNAARLYTLSTAVESFGAATFKSTLRPSLGDSFQGLSKPTASIDFDPGIDRLTVLNGDAPQISVAVDSGLVTTPFQSPISDSPAQFYIATFGSFAPSPDPARQRSSFLTRTFEGDFGPVTGFDIRGVDGLQIITRRADQVSGSVLETSLLSTVVPSFRALIGGGEPVAGIAYLPVAQAMVFALTTDNKLLTFRPTTPSRPDAVMGITGLQPEEKLLAIEVRLADELLYALSDRGRIYTLDSRSGAATLRSTLSGPSVPALLDQEADVAFTPTSGLLRVSASGGRNFRVDVDTGAVTLDAAYSRGMSEQVSRFTGVAYFRGSSSVASSRLLLADAANRRLAAPADPAVAANAIVAVGRLPFAIGDLVGFDITPELEGLFIGSTREHPTVLLKSNLQFSGSSEVGAIALPAANDHVTGFSVSLDERVAAERRPMVAVLNRNSLLSFTRTTLQTPSAPVPVTGMLTGESLLCIDFQANGMLFGLGSSGSIYIINPQTGAVSPDRVVLGASLQGTVFDMDFDPVSGDLTVVSDARQVLIIDSVGRATVQSFNYPPVSVTATAYTSPQTSDHFFIDTVSASLQLLQSDSTSPFGSNETDESTVAEIVSVAPINPLESSAAFTPLAAFDIAAGADAVPLAALQPVGSGQSLLYVIDLEPFGILRGAGRPLGPIGAPGTAPIRGLAIRIQ